MTERYALGVTIWLFDVFSTFVTARPFFSADHRDDIASVAGSALFYMISLIRMP
jgi:hypothetical protein